MKISFLAVTAVLLLATIGHAESVAVVGDDILSASLQVCAKKSKITRDPMTLPLPPGFKGEFVTIESESASCTGQYAAVTTPAGEYFVGTPWSLQGMSGTPAEKIRQFGRERLRQSFTAEIDGSRSKSGLFHVVILQKTESGDVPMEGWIDGEGTTFFAGSFRSMSDDIAKQRLADLQKVFATAPARGSQNAPVSIVEFSDFQCPSCKRAASYVKPILEKYGDKVRFTRADLPLISSHPWAFGAALAGRAIYRQSPEAFWKFKDAVYEMQAELSMFTLEDFATGFVKDNDLNLPRYQKEIESPELRAEILSSVGAAFSQGIFGTPTYLVNGVMVDADADGSGLDNYVAKLLAK